MALSGDQIEEIETALARVRPEGWRRAKDVEFRQLSIEREGSSAWKVDFPVGKLSHPLVDHVFLVIDANFPYSEPRVIVPQAIIPQAPRWPHVESNGLLCLATTKISASASQRILTALQDAFDVLTMNTSGRQDEFRREFTSYWSQEVKNDTPRGYSLLADIDKSRDIYFYWAREGKIVFADDEAKLQAWLKNAGISEQKAFATTRLIWLPEPLSPEEYPLEGRDVLALGGTENIIPHIRVGNALPIVFGTLINEVPIFAGAVLHGASKKFHQKGFRPNKTRPPYLVVASYAGRSVSHMSIDRVDANWVHGRDVNSHLQTLSKSSVAVLGCGAIGGYLAQGLAQAGVGKLDLIDNDEFKPGNLGRHVLGSGYIGKSKVRGLAQHLRQNYPTISQVNEYVIKFQSLNAAQLAKLEDCSLLVLAGVDLEAELAVDRWISTLEKPPYRVWTWTEEFALAGHAVALMGVEYLQDFLDKDGHFNNRLTKGWSRNGTLIDEAGCGTSFQPYDAVDMMNTVLMAQRLVIDVLLGNVAESTRRSWLGNRELVKAKGGELSKAFDRSYAEISEALN